MTPTLPKTLSALKRERERIQREGYILNAWISSYQPGGTARGEHTYYHLRSRTSLAHGKYSRHLKEQEVDAVRQQVENGRRWKQVERAIARMERKAQSARAVLTSSASDEWYTPPRYIDLAREVMGGIDCDPATNATAQVWIGATHAYTREDNGLMQPWTGRVWLNPPYGSHMSLWTEKAVSAWETGVASDVIMLVRPAVGSAWFQALYGRFVCCIPHKRIRFMNAEGVEQKSPVHGNAFFYLGERVERFLEVFGVIGPVTWCG